MAQARGKAFDSETGSEASKKRKNCVGGKTFSLEANCNANAETISQAVFNTMYWFDKPRVKTDEDVLERIKEFFEKCAESGEFPTVEKLCVALGYTRKTLCEWEKGSKGQHRAILIQQAKEALASIDSDLVQQGKIPAVPYIFRSKNYYGMADVQKVEVDTTNALGEMGSMTAIEQKYIDALPMLEE